MLYLLDTDHISLLQRQGARTAAVRARMKRLPPDDFGVSIVTYEEQMKGRLRGTHDAKDIQSQVAAYASLHQTLRYYLMTAVWDYTPRAAEIFAGLKTQKINVGTQDLKIAAIALANEAILLTCNAQHFSRVPLLQFEDWTVAYE